MLKGSIAATKGSSHIKASDNLNIEAGNIWDENSEVRFTSFYKGDDIDKIGSQINVNITLLKSVLLFGIPLVFFIFSSIIGLITISKWIF